jgi:P27 family predicted phage terminase small subunit
MPRHRLPNATKKLIGTRPDRMNPGEPVSPPDLGEPPDDFVDVEVKAWNWLKSRLAEMAIGAKADQHQAMLYCRHYRKWHEAEEVLARDGLLVEERSESAFVTRNGERRTVKATVKTNPLVKVSNESARQMSKILATFAMSPAARSSLHVEADGPEDDPFMNFMTRKPPRNPVLRFLAEAEQEKAESKAKREKALAKPKKRGKGEPS